ncbi:hypothetical protein ACOTCW_04240 [Achromobacter xylosoxidans]
MGTPVAEIGGWRGRAKGYPGRRAPAALAANAVSANAKGINDTHSTVIQSYKAGLLQRLHECRLDRSEL